MISNSGHVMTLANSIIGVGILAMPFCFQKCGIILSIALLVLNNLITRVSCHYLIKSSLLTRRKSFEFLGFHAFGSSGKLLVELCIIGYLIGSCITYFVVVGDVGPQIVAKVFDLNGTAQLRTWVMIIVTIICILPLGMLKNIDSLSAVCTASIGFYLCLVVKTILESETHILANDWQGKIVYWEPSGVLQCLPIFSMALSCQMQIFEILESVNNQSQEKLNAIIKNATWMCTVVYIAVGVFGYVAFCTQTFSGNILINFSPTFGSDVIKIGFVLSVAFSFPLVIFPCRNSIYSLLYRRGHTDMTGYIPEARFKSITVFIVTGSLCIALLIPSIELVIGLVGSTIGILICIIFPAACFRKISKKDSTERTLAQSIIVGGCCLMILGTYANLSAIDKKNFESPSIIVERTTGAALPLPQFEKSFKMPPKEAVKEIPLQNISQQEPKSEVVEEKRPALLEKLVEQPKINPPLPVDVVEQEVIVKAPEVKKQIEKSAVETTPVIEGGLLASKAPMNVNGIAKEAIKNDEEIAAEEQQKDADKQEQLTKAENELKKTKELLERKVDELKEELAKQTKATQDLVVEKLGQVVEKVEQIEREVHKVSKNEEQPKKIEIPKASLLGMLTDRQSPNTTKEAERKAVFEPLSYQTGETLKKTHDVVGDNANVQDPRAPLPLPLLINASQGQVYAKEPPPLVQIPLESTSKLIGSFKSKLPVDEVAQHVVPANDSKSPQLEKEKENIEAIRRDILELNKNRMDSSITLKSSREKRSASDIDFSKTVAKLQEENCRNEFKVDTLQARNGLDVKLEGLRRDIKSVNDEE